MTLAPSKNCTRRLLHVDTSSSQSMPSTSEITLACFRLHGIILGIILLKRFMRTLLQLSRKLSKDWNHMSIDVTEAVLLGLDCFMIAGTGSRKTMPFAMPLLVDKTKKKMVKVIFLLNDMEDDQVSIIFFW